MQKLRSHFSQKAKFGVCIKILLLSGLLVVHGFLKETLFGTWSILWYFTLPVEYYILLQLVVPREMIDYFESQSYFTIIFPSSFIRQWSNGFSSIIIHHSFCYTLWQVQKFKCLSRMVCVLSPLDSLPFLGHCIFMVFMIVKQCLLFQVQPLCNRLKVEFLSLQYKDLLWAWYRCQKIEKTFPRILTSIFWPAPSYWKPIFCLIM